MKSIIFITICNLIFCLAAKAQTPVQRLESVSKEFIERYQQEYHEYNPLHIGDLWQFINYSGNYSEKEIVKDTLVLNKRYFKKFDYMFIYNAYTWERNDSTNRSSYCLDIQDLDEDGDSLDDLLLDSLEVVDNTEYTSYRYTWKPWDPDPKIAFVFDSLWIRVFGDTVVARVVEYIPPFQGELVADKYGVVEIYPEGSPPLLLTGMIINGVTYGNIVNVDKTQESFPSKFKLFNNYPNPFNPVTTIRYQVAKETNVKIEIFNSIGQKVRTLVNETKSEGYYSIEWDGKGDFNMTLSSGVYFYKMTAGTFVSVQKMAFLK